MSKLYFIQADSDGPIKIGYSADPEHRLSMLQTGNHRELRLIAAVDFSQGHGGDRTASAMEDLWHRTFRIVRIRGEWFEPHPKLLWAIDCMKNNVPFEMEPLQ